MADNESEDEFESAESETELTDKDITDKFPSMDTKNKTMAASLHSIKESPPPASQTMDVKMTQVTVEGQTNVGNSSEGQQKQDPKSPSETIPTAQTDSNTGPQSQSQTEFGGGWGWGWGGTIGSLLSSSVSAVSESAQSIGKGIESMVTNVEGALGVPQPTEMIRDPPSPSNNAEERSKSKEDKSGTDTEGNDEDEVVQTENKTEEPAADPEQPSGVGGFLSGFTSAVQSTGIELMSGGLDALEAIGRKTVDILSEGDPGLRNKRAALSGKATTLSQLLREAKQEAESIQEMMTNDGNQSSDMIVNYSILFDQYEGLVHLEALELLSKDCKNKVFASLSAFSGQELEKRNKRIEELDKYFQEEEEEGDEPTDSSESITDILNILDDLGKKAKAEKLIKACEDARKRISELGTQTQQTDEVPPPPEGDNDVTPSEGDKVKKEDQNDTPTSDETMPNSGLNTSSDHQSISVKEYHDTGLHVLAQLTSLTIELLKKSAEIMLLQDVVKLDNSSDLGQMFQRVTRSICTEFEAITTLLTDKISQETSDEADTSITSLYLESSNSCSYIQDAFKLLQPVLQLLVLGNIEKTSSATSSQELSS